MNIACGACRQTLMVSRDQIGMTIQCPSCRAVQMVQNVGDRVAGTMVKCPGCAIPLAVPESTGASTFRCPKCGQYLSIDAPAPAIEMDSWAETPANGAASQSGRSFYSGHPLHRLGDEFGSLGANSSELQNQLPRTAASTQWSVDHSYSPQVGSVVPGALLLIQASCGLLLCAVQFFYAMGITDAERLAESDVQTLKLTLITSSALGGLYLFLIAMGAIQMIVRQRLWAGRTACVLAILPLTFFAYGLFGTCFAIALYPLALVGGIWGLIALLGRTATKKGVRTQ